MKRNWTQTGFWLVLGLAGGMLISDLTQVKTVEAKGSTSRYQDYCMVTGRSYDNEIDLLWFLDYRTAQLHGIITDRNGRLQRIAGLDLLEQFQLEEGLQPHFMMVAGNFNVQSTDLIYLAEITTGQVLSILPPNIRVGQRGVAAQPVRVVDRFQFRPEEIRPQ